MIEKAVVERIEGFFATLRIVAGRRTVRVPLKLLPVGVQEGDRLLVEFDGNELVRVRLDRGTGSLGR